MIKFWITFLFPLLIFGQAELNQANQFIEDKGFYKAEQLLLKFLDQNPNNLKGIELLGDTYSFQKKWDEAIDEFKKLVNFNPKNADYHYKYGGVLGMKALENKLKSISFIGDIKASFLKAAELDSTHIETRWALVELFMQLPGILGGGKSKSLKYAEELEKLSTVDGYLAKGYIYEYDDEPKLAEKYYKLAINQGGSLTCFNKLSTLYENTNEPEKAIKIIEEAQQKHNRNSLHYQIGKIAAEYNIQLQKGEQCLKTYIKNYSVQDGVPKAWAHYRLAQIHMHQHNKQEALKYIELALAELPKIRAFEEQKEKIVNM